MQAVFKSLFPRVCWKVPGRKAGPLRVPGVRGVRKTVRPLRKCSFFFRKFANFCLICKISEGSFSAVSKLMIASKHSCCSIFQALEDLRTFPTPAPLQTQTARYTVPPSAPLISMSGMQVGDKVSSEIFCSSGRIAFHATVLASV